MSIETQKYKSALLSIQMYKTNRKYKIVFVYARGALNSLVLRLLRTYLEGVEHMLTHMVELR